MSVIKRLPIIIAVLTLAPSAWSAKPGELRFDKVTRLTHPNYSISEFGYGLRDLWNSDGTRIQFFENGGQKWARLSDLRAWTTETQYLAARHSIDSNFATFLEWSRLPGENNILYGAYKSTKMIVRLDTDTGQMTPVVSYDPGDGRTLNPYIKGYTTDGHLVVDLNQEVWASGAYEINLQTKTRVLHANALYPDKARWPDLSHGHGSINPSHTQRVTYYGENTVRTWPAETLVRNLPNNYYGPAGPIRAMTHITWKVSDEWWISDDYGKAYYGGALIGQLPTAPHIESYTLNQCWTDGTCKVLHEIFSAGDFRDAAGNTGQNYQGSVIPTMNKDPNRVQVLYDATEGKFSKKDFDTYGVTPWGNNVLFLLELAPVTATANRCDLNASGAPDAPDLQLLTNQILNGLTNTTYDINRDTQVNAVDLQVLGNVVLGVTPCP